MSSTVFAGRHGQSVVDREKKGSSRGRARRSMVSAGRERSALLRSDGKAVVFPLPLGEIPVVTEAGVVPQPREGADTQGFCFCPLWKHFTPVSNVRGRG